MKTDEIKKLDVYLKRIFGPKISVEERPNKSDSAEVFMNSEFIGLLYLDDEDGDLSYNFSMAILSEDL